jgi:hypothetical protein
MADVPSGELSGDWGKAYVETVTIGENSVTNMFDAATLVASKRADKTGVFVFIRRRNAESPYHANNEFGGCSLDTNITGTARSGMRFRDDRWSTGVGMATNYDAVISAGSVFDVVSIVQNKKF